MDITNLLANSHLLPAPSIEVTHTIPRAARKSTTIVSLMNKIRRTTYGAVIADALVCALSPLILSMRGFNGWLKFLKVHRLLCTGEVERLRYEEGKKGGGWTGGRNLVYCLDPTSEQVESNEGEQTTYVLVHGGAWGTGNAAFYLPFLLNAENGLGSCAVVGYGMSPAYSADEQADEVVKGVEEVGRRIGGGQVVIVGHSSGAHVGFKAAMKIIDSNRGRRNPRVRVKGYIGLSGVYDVSMHYDYEARRGLEQLSPMQLANGWTREGMRRCGCEAAVNEVINKGGVEGGGMRVVLVHGTRDTTVPFTQAFMFARFLREARGEIVSEVEEVYGDWDHQDTVLDATFGGEGWERATRVMEGKEEGGWGGKSKL